MKISNELQTQVDRYVKTRSFALDAPLKRELAQWYKYAGYGTLNIGCGTCIRNAMQKLSNHYLTEMAPKSPVRGAHEYHSIRRIILASHESSIPLVAKRIIAN